SVQRFDIGHPHRELEPFEIDALVDDRVEHETVVGARGKTESQLHRPSRISRPARARASTASDSFQSARLRRSIMFETARTSANGTPLTRQAYMNAAPSMLSTCGANRSLTVAIDRSRPCTVFTVMPRTAARR